MTDGGALDGEAVRNYIRSIYAAGMVVGEDARPFPVAPDDLPAAVGETLRDLALLVGAAHTVQVGMGHGLATLFLCEALIALNAPQTRHLAIDPFQREHFQNAGLKVLREAGVADIVDFHERPSQLVLPELLAEGQQFDLAFIDADHRFEAVFIDLYYLHRLVKPGGVIVLDDAWMPPVRTAIKYFVTNVGLELTPAAGLGRQSSIDTRSWWHRVTKGSPRLCVLQRPPELPNRPFWGHFVPFADPETGLMRAPAAVLAEDRLRRGIDQVRPLLRRVPRC